MPQVFDDVGECVETVLRRLGSRIVLALPLGIGKPHPFVNELFRRAQRDPKLSLTIVTALSLAPPHPKSDLERRLMQPLIARVFGDAPLLDYATAARRGTLPPNVRVIEFFLEPGTWLGVESAQRNYLSANYTHVARDLMALGVNLIAHLVARRQRAGNVELSLGSNPDVTVDLLPLVEAAREQGRDVAMVGEIHGDMPFMLGHARVEPAHFDYLVDHSRYDYPLFCPPNLPLRTLDHAIAMHVSTLVKDGGTLQIGIGELGDALCYALLLRHQQTAAWRAAAAELGSVAVEDTTRNGAFVAGLYACTEMLVDQMLDLYRAGVLRRHVYDSLPLMTLLARGHIDDRFTGEILDHLASIGVGPRLDADSFERLRHFGVFRSGVRFENGQLIDEEGQRHLADWSDSEVRRGIEATCLGRELRNGHVAHAGFFLGPRSFYSALRNMPERELRQFDMRGVGFVNQLYGTDLELRSLQRKHARFVNTAMMVTLLGAAVSDALEDGRVVSGVGGQYNFVAMAHALPDARSILCVRSTRTKDGVLSSNLIWNYGHTTIPRHLRDVVVTEYGIADLRGRTDEEVIAALLNIADSRFQGELLARAKAARKIAQDYEIPAAHRRNTPERLAGALATHREAGRFSEYPFGTDLTAEEIVLASALPKLADASRTLRGRLTLLASAWLTPVAADAKPYLLRMGLEQPRSWRERFSRRLVALALHRSRGN